MDDTLPPSKPLRTPGSDSREEASPDAETRQIATREKNVGPYAIELKIGEGGMGKVYRCFDPALKRRVAVKVLHEKYSKDARYQARFRREAQAIAGLSHPSVAQVYSIETLDDGGLFLVMEYVDGRSLDELLERRGALSPREAIRLIRQVALGLQAAFHRGIVHRDVKPSNLLVKGDGDGTEGSVKIVDFGLAKDLEADGSITDEGIVLGTPHYISPEQGRGQKVDQRSDIYSLGATFYHVVTGRPPFEGKSQIEVIVAHVQDKPVAPHRLRQDLPEGISHVIGKMMASRREDRYPSYDELLEDLEHLEKGEPVCDEAFQGGRFEIRPPRGKRRRALSLGLVAVLALVAGVLLAHGIDRRHHLADLPDVPPGWYLEETGGVDLDFSRSPPDPQEARQALAKVLFIPSQEDGNPQVLDGSLVWENYTQPFACRYSFGRVDQIQLHVAGHRGLFDLGVALVDPYGNSRRQLLLRLRPDEPTPGAVEALLNNEPVALNPELPPLPRLVPPYSVFLEFSPGERGTHLKLRITRPSEVFPVYDRDCDLEGIDWASGVPVLKTSSPRYPFRVIVNRIVISGSLSSTVEEVPWQS